MRTIKEIVRNSFLETDPNSVLFKGAVVVWLYWNGERNEWEWSSSHYTISFDSSKLDKCNIYYFVYSKKNDTFHFICVYSIKSGLWVKPSLFHAFKHLIKHELKTTSYAIFEGDTLDLFIYDAKAPYMRQVIYPKEATSEKMWRFLSYIIPFRK